MEETEMEDLDKLIKDAIDMHIHAAPDTMPMRVDVVEAAQQAKDAGMKAIVIKNHSYPTAPLVTMAKKIVPDIEIVGSICLDYEIGGLNSYALEASAQLGAKVVWMPTSSSANSRRKMIEGLNIDLKGEGYSILNSNGELVPEIGEILKIISEYNMVLASGHISPDEIFTLFSESKKFGIDKLVVTHASSTEVSERVPNLEEQKKLAQMGAFIEHTGNEIMPCDFGHDPAEMVELIKGVGAQHCILSSDMGMAWGTYPAEGMRLFVSALLSYGITASEIEQMIKSNPSELLDLN
jgi:hypothetical protein